MEQKTILLIEDEVAIRDLLSYSLRKEGYAIEEASSGKEGLAIVEKNHPDLILLDLMLPDINGFDICKQVSELFIPVIMITAKADTLDKVLGMELGADDYITKPFDIREVISRVRVIFRRMDLLENKKKVQEIYVHGNTKILRDKREVWKDGSKIVLTNKEYDLLLFFSENKERVFSRTDILDLVWGYEFVADTRTVDIHIQRIRRKLDQSHSSSIIETVFGIGYKMISG